MSTELAQYAHWRRRTPRAASYSCRRSPPRPMPSRSTPAANCRLKPPSIGTAIWLCGQASSLDEAGCSPVYARPFAPVRSCRFCTVDARSFQTVWLEDVCTAIERALERELTGVLHVAHPDPVPIRRFYEAIASLVDRRCRFVRLPAGPLLVALRSAERLGVALPISSENVLGLKHLHAVDLGPDLRRLDLSASIVRRCPGVAAAQLI